MIEFKFKLNKETISATVPEGWHEVKLKHILALEENWSGTSSDMIGLLSAFTGQDYRTLENAKGDLWNPLFQVLSFVFDAPKWDKIKPPKQVRLNGKTLTPPKKLEMQTFGQKVLALKLISEQEHIKNIPDIIAIYLQPVYDGLFESERIPDIRKHVLEMKAYDSMPYGLFFLKKLLRLKNFGKLGLRASRKTLRNLKSIQQQVAIN